MPNIFLGSKKASRPQVLIEYGINVVLNAAEDNCDQSEGYALKDKLTLGLSDSSDVGADDLISKLARSIKFLDDNVWRGHRVLIHCNMGVSRSCFVLCVWLMKTTGVEYSEAFEYIRAVRECVSPHWWFVTNVMLDRFFIDKVETCVDILNTGDPNVTQPPSFKKIKV
jgi:dual specificity phosphatase 12